MEVSVKNLVNEFLNGNHRSIKVRDLKQALTIYVQALEAANKENADLIDANYQLKKEIVALRNNAKHAEEINAVAKIETESHKATIQYLSKKFELAKETINDQFVVIGKQEDALNTAREVMLQNVIGNKPTNEALGKMKSENAALNEALDKMKSENAALRLKADERRNRATAYVNRIRTECADWKREAESRRIKIKDLDNQLTQARRWADMVSHGQMGEILKIVEDARKTIDDQKITIDKLDTLVNKQHAENQNLRAQVNNQALLIKSHQNTARSYIRTGCVAVDIEPAIFLWKAQKMGKMQKEIKDLENALFEKGIEWERAKLTHFRHQNFISFRVMTDANLAYVGAEHRLKEAKEALAKLTNGE